MPTLKRHASLVNTGSCHTLEHSLTINSTQDAPVRFIRQQSAFMLLAKLNIAQAGQKSKDLGVKSDTSVLGQSHA